MENKTITIIIENEMLKKIDIIATKEERGRSFIIRKAIAEYLINKEKHLSKKIK